MTDNHDRTIPTTADDHDRTTPTTADDHDDTFPTTADDHNRTIPTTADDHNRTIPTMADDHDRTIPTTADDHDPTIPTTADDHDRTIPTTSQGCLSFGSFGFSAKTGDYIEKRTSYVAVIFFIIYNFVPMNFSLALIFLPSKRNSNLIVACHDLINFEQV